MKLPDDYWVLVDRSKGKMGEVIATGKTKPKFTSSRSQEQMTVKAAKKWCGIKQEMFKLMLSIIGNALGLGLKIMDKMEKNSDKPSFEEFKARKKEMDNTLADGDVEGIDSMFEYLADRARAGKTGRKG